MVEKLGFSQTYKEYVKGDCKDNPAAARFAQRLLHESENVRIIDGGMPLHEPVLYKKLDDQFYNVLHEKFGVGADAEHLVSYRLTKDHVTFHSTMYPRRGNSCSYLIECHSHGRVVFDKVVCYISYQNIAYALLLKYNIIGLNVCQGLPLACYKMLFYEKLSEEIFWGKILWKFRKQTFQLLLTVMLL